MGDFKKLAYPFGVKLALLKSGTATCQDFPSAFCFACACMFISLPAFVSSLGLCSLNLLYCLFFQFLGSSLKSWNNICYSYRMFSPQDKE